MSSRRTLVALVASALLSFPWIVRAESYFSRLVPLGRSVYPVVRLAPGSGVPAGDRGRFSSLYALGEIQPGPGEGLLDVVAVLDSPGTADVLAAAGLLALGRMGRVVSMRVGVGDLERLAGLPGVLLVRPPQALRMHLDVNTVENGAIAARNAAGVTGAGTIVAVIDSGIDYTHPDFRHADGTTRIKWLWDQFDNSYADSNGAIGGPPPEGDGGGPASGTVYSEAQLNAALQGTAIVNSVDLPGHGTLVASAAAGNGLGTGNGQPAGVYVGVAPEADIVAVRVGGADKTDFSITGDLIAALDWIDARAAELEEPVVVNMSFGGHQGPHDGTTPEELAIGEFAGRPGRAVAVSAGNEGAKRIHASGSALGSHTLQVFNAAQSPVMQIDCWLPGTDTIDLGFIDPSGDGRPVLGVKEGSCAVTNGAVNTVTGCLLEVNPTNGGREAVFFVQPSGGAAPMSAGNWRFILRDKGGVVDGQFDCWSVFSQEFSADADGGMSVAQPGTAGGAITVGAESARREYPSLDGTITVASAVLGALAGFSSLGPTRDGRVKPDLVTGGNRVIGAWSIGDGSGSGIAKVPPDPSQVTPDEMHVASQGTSFAAPQVAGAVALLFEIAPTLTGADARAVLVETARADQFTGPVPNPGWGYGKLDVLAAVASVSEPASLTPTATGTATAGATTSTPTPTSTRTVPLSRTPTPQPTPQSSGGGSCAVTPRSPRPAAAPLMLAWFLVARIAWGWRRRSRPH